MLKTKKNVTLGHKKLLCLDFNNDDFDPNNIVAIMQKIVDATENKIKG